MLKLTSLSTVFFWLFIVFLSISVGAGFYEHTLVNSLWTSDPPTSVLGWYQHNAADPQFALSPGRFWMIVSPLTVLFTLLAFVTAFLEKGKARNWRLVATGLTLVVMVCTFFWFVPNLRMLTGRGVLEMAPDSIASLTNMWATLNIGRIAVSSAAWLIGLRALGMSNVNE
ncbi:MAG: DUF1772 domain-containing protein [Pyrinomonadaceae bacterium]